MKAKSFLIFSIFCLIISIIFSSFMIFISIIVIGESKSLLCEIKDSEINLIDGKNKIIEQEKNIVNAKDKYLIVSENKKESLGEFKLTAYCSCEKCCGEWALNRPKDENGKDIVYGSTGVALIAGTSIAVDPSVIPYGSNVEINGHTYTAQDTGGAIQGNRIDVYFDNHQDALNFGVQYAEVFLIVGSEKNE